MYWFQLGAFILSGRDLFFCITGGAADIKGDRTLKNGKNQRQTRNISAEMSYLSAVFMLDTSA